MNEEEFKNVWYLPKEVTWENKSLFPVKHKGILKLKGDHLEFIRNNELIKISNIKKISFGKQGRDFINNWVIIDYEDGKKAFFADGSSIGWGGILGGTNRIFNAIKDNIKPQIITKQTDKEPEKINEEIIQTTKDDIKNDAGIETVKNIEVIDYTKTVQYKDRTVAMLLAIFFGFWAWIYTWKKDQWKFWVGLGVTIVTWGFGYIAFWIWAIVDAASKTQEFYSNYPN